MSVVDVATQVEFDAAVRRGDEPRVVAGEFAASGSASVWASGSASVAASGSASVRAYGSASVAASGSASVRASGSASVRAYDSASVWAYGSASVWASGSASVWAYGSASVRAYDSASVRAYGSASVWASGSASVRAYGSASVAASGSASVRASGSASVRAYDSASVRAYDSASVRASAAVAVHVHGCGPKVVGGVRIDVPDRFADPREWCEFHGLPVSRAGRVTLYKAVEGDWRGGTKHDAITYRPGDKPEAHDWNPEPSCGRGLHLVARPWEGERYLSGSADHYVACRVSLNDVVVIDNTKVKVRKVHKVTECDQDGEALS